MPILAQPINCTLKSEGASSTDAMIDLLAKAFREQSVEVAETIRVAAHNILPGVSSDEGQGDDWPRLRQQILAADILIFGTPIWMGQPSSVGKRVLERMDAFLDETDDQGRMPSYSKLAVVAVVGNEDGAHHVAAELFQALNDVGWTIPAAGCCYWVGEAMGDVDFKDLARTPKLVAEAAEMVAQNAAHLAGVFKANPYPGAGSK
ncbi:MAG TPA: flavodoxin family protein [Caulobacteraceae bacterium]|jgi:multimeric flavodoxin WrbA